MKQHRFLAAIVVATTVMAGPLHAGCYADYRARMDNPLRLHYGVVELPANACSVAAAPPVVSSLIAAGGWTLLEVVSVFDDAGLDARRENAGEYFLRF